MMLLRLKLPQKSLASIYCISEKAIKQKLFLYKERVGIKMSIFHCENTLKHFEKSIRKVFLDLVKTGGVNKTYCI